MSQALTEVGKALTYMENGKGPNIDPWETPTVINLLDEKVFYTHTVLPHKKLFIHPYASSLTP